MFRFAVLAGLALAPALAAEPILRPGSAAGHPAMDAELRGFFAIAPDGQGLPPGQGRAKQGAKIYAERCAPCHGAQLQGNPDTGGEPLIGGQGSLKSAAPLYTVESYWPYATTLLDYIKRAMPFDSPGSLTDNEVYDLVAFILSKARIIKPDQPVNSVTLPKISMPNRNGFVPDPRPEIPGRATAKAPRAQ